MEKYCNRCDKKSIPLAAHESAMARADNAHNLRVDTDFDTAPFCVQSCVGSL